MAVDPLRDFAPVTQVVAVHFVMVANPALPAKNVAELIALAKSRPGQINYSSSGPGGAPHLAGELFKSMAKVDIVHVPYKGSAPSFQDLLGGRVSFTCDSLVQALPYVRDKRLVALADTALAGGGRYTFDGVEHQVALSQPQRQNAIHGLLRWRSWRE